MGRTGAIAGVPCGLTSPATASIEALQSVVAREISPLDSAVVTVGSIHGGTAFNIIPGSVRLTGTARSFTEATGKALPEKIRRIVAGTAAACGVEADVRYERVNSATVNDARMADLVIETAARLLGEENVETDTRTLGGEDDLRVVDGHLAWLWHRSRRDGVWHRSHFVDGSDGGLSIRGLFSEMSGQALLRACANGPMKEAPSFWQLRTMRKR